MEGTDWDLRVSRYRYAAHTPVCEYTHVYTHTHTHTHTHTLVCMYMYNQTTLLDARQ